MITEIMMVLSKNTLQRFPNLRREAHHTALMLLISKTQVVEKFVENYLKCELCYVNTNHRLFLKNRAALEDANKDGEEDLSFEKKNVKKIKVLLELYIHIIKNQLMDIVPKTVVCFMVHSFRDDLHTLLVTNLFESQKVGDLMKEDLFTEEKREKALKMLQALEKADAVTSLLD
jgi:hypothetical protein